MARPRARRRRRAISTQLTYLVAIIAAVIIAYHVALFVWNRTAPREVQVPKVAGMPTSDAISVLKTAGLQSEIVVERPDEKVAAGVVIGSDPPAARLVKAGRLVHLVVSSGSRWAKVPEVSKMSIDRAKAVLSSAHLSLGRQTPAYSDTVPSGYIIDQTPKPGGRLARNSEVAVSVSLGVKPETASGEEPPAPNEEHTTDVQIVVPPGANLQEVKIVVRDSSGVRTVYRRNYQPGEIVSQTVHGTGPEATVEVYLSGVLAETRNF